MARKVVRIEIPTSRPDDLLTLFEAALAKHKALGQNSPLTGIDMVLFEQVVTQVRPLRDLAKDFERQAQVKFEQAANLMGVGMGQSSHTAGTLYFDLLRIRDLLLAMFRGHENELETWGFSVVTGTAASPKRKDPNA